MPQPNVWYFRGEGGSVYGPATAEKLLDWVRDGRVEPTGYVSQDRREWVPPQLLGWLEMKWLVEVEPGKTFGPFHRAFVTKMAHEGSVPEGAKLYRLHELAIDEDPPPEIVEKVVEKIVEKRVEVPVEKIVEKVVEKEVRVEVPVEKIVEKVIEVEPPARKTFVVPEVVETTIDAPPPRKLPGGIFKGTDPARLAALEAAARRELSAAKRHGFGIGGIFGKH